MLEEKGPTVLEIEFNQKIPNGNFDKVIINLKSKRNIIQLARSEKKFYDLYINMLQKDYMFYMHTNEKSYFIKRKLLSTIWQRTDLNQYGDLFYSIEDTPVERMNRLAPRRMVVIFSSMPAASDYFSPNIGTRCFYKNFPSLPKHVIKNTIIMRIMDANLSHGSHYISTPNYPNFEAEVQGAIKQAMEEYAIDKDDVVLYGGSKGGTGALYHGLLGDYKVVAVDPIISLKEYSELDDDSHFLKLFREPSLEGKLKELAENPELVNEKLIIGSPTVIFNYRIYSKLANQQIKIMDIFDSGIKVHADVAKYSNIEQVTAINNFLLQSANLQKMNKNSYDIIVENYSNFR